MRVPYRLNCSNSCYSRILSQAIHSRKFDGRVQTLLFLIRYLLHLNLNSTLVEHDIGKSVKPKVVKLQLFVLSNHHIRSNVEQIYVTNLQYANQVLRHSQV